MSMSMKCTGAFVRSAIATMLIASLSSCMAFQPKPTSTPMAMPSQYDQTPLPASTASAPNTAQQFQAGAKPVTAWWTLYQSESLNNMVDEGLQNSPNLAAAEKRLTAAREQLSARVGSSTLPSLDFGANAVRQRELGIPIPGAGTDTLLFNTFVGQLQASYTIDLFGATRYTNSALSSRVDASIFQVDAARRALAANIVTSTITVAALRDQLSATERLVALVKEDVFDSERRYSLGAGSHSDMLAVQQNAATLQASVSPLRQQLSVARNTLSVLIGRTPSQPPIVPALNELQLPQRIPVVVPSELLRTRPDILANEALLKAASDEFGVATARMFPQLTLSAGLGRGGFNWSMLTSGAGDIWGVGASLTQPLFRGGALRSERRAAQASYEAAAESYKETVLSAFQDVADTLTSLEHGAQALDASHQASTAASNRADEISARVRLGALAPSSARSTEQQYRKAQVDEINAKAEQLANTARLFQAMGTPPSIHTYSTETQQ